MGMLTPHLFPALGFGALIGLALGLMGAGGSILTVPILVYAIGMPVQAATGTSLAIVGLNAAVAFGVVLPALPTMPWKVPSTGDVSHVVPVSGEKTPQDIST